MTGVARRIALLALGGLVAACASAGLPSPDDDPELPQAIELTVENGVDRDVRVYLLRGGSRIRLGTVTSLTSRTFRVPRVLLSRLDPLKLGGAALGGGALESSGLVVEPGDRVVWELGPWLGQSSLWIR